MTSAHKLTHKTVKSYFKYLDGKPEDHAGFKKCVSKLISRVCEDPRPSMEVLKTYGKDVPTERVAEDRTPPIASISFTS